MIEEYDIGVVGAGPGGISAAVEASSLGARVLVVEKDEVGGVCLNKGCIPTKAFLKSALLYDELKRSTVRGINYKDLSYDLPHIKNHTREIVNRMRGQIESTFKLRKISYLKGRATFLDNQHILVDDKEMKAHSFIIACGSSPRPLSSLAVDNKRIFYSDGIFDIERMPKDIAIVGAGPIGCEFASFFSVFGVEVTLIEMLERILPKEDVDISKRLEGIFKKRNIKILTSCSSLDFSTINSEVILISIGRMANINDLGLEKIGVTIKKGAIFVDEYLQTNLPGIFAVGDCIGKYNLAHVASAEGRVAARNALGGKFKIDYTIVPQCVYSFPEVASVGLTSDDAVRCGYEVRVGRTHFAALGRAQAYAETEGFIKLVVDKKSEAILGAQILGYYASELIGTISVAIKGKLKVKELADVVQAHPTFSEGIQEVALGLLRQAI
ncbi:MAG: hypothetical protein AMJ78_06050 [Omnitrophica WOR_2 bacterium SM23_29]|nr:MAG: hypothetical protein AMJ78_06050 [Omnitrophica WOR_2 bacterium SM23_29]